MLHGIKKYPSLKRFKDGYSFAWDAQLAEKKLVALKNILFSHICRGFTNHKAGAEQSDTDGNMAD